jgi:hypothetical protein
VSQVFSVVRGFWYAAGSRVGRAFHVAASEVSEAALGMVGVGAEQLATGYFCDPTTKSNLRIVAKPGLVLRLSRNFDKQRGFVYGAYAIVCESLLGNAVFTAQLVGTGNMVLIHPMEEKGRSVLCRFATGVPPPSGGLRVLISAMVVFTSIRRGLLDATQ